MPEMDGPEFYRRLLAASPLARVLWVTITFHALACTTLDRSLDV